MATIIKLEGNLRTEFGKGAAHRLRAAGRIPASVYTSGQLPQFLDLPVREATNALRRANAIYELKFGDEDRLAVVKEVQRNPVKRTIEHIDFYEVEKGEKIEVSVPIIIEGETKGNGVAFVSIHEVTVRAEISHLPEKFILSVEGLLAGDKIVASQIELPQGAELIDIDPEEVIVSVEVPRESAAASTEGKGAAEEGATAESKTEENKSEAKSEEK